MWKVAPLVELRAWTLRDAPLDYAGDALPLAVTPPAAFEASRQFLWATYDNDRGGLRFEAIAHRDVTATGPALGLGTAQHRTRTYHLGLRGR